MNENKNVISSKKYGCDRFRKDFWVHFGTLERTQAFTAICGIRFIVIQTNTSINLGHGFKKANYADDLLFLCSIKTTFLNIADITYGML